MSRIGRLPIDIPADVTISVDGQDVAVKGPKGELALTVSRPIEVKIEVNCVMRGTVHPVAKASLVPRARDALLADLEIPIVSFADVYGGKLVAAMDRQHPRDLFDVMQLLDHEGITAEVRRAFVIYLASHNRPVHEVLFPARRDIAQAYERTFKGMTNEPVELKALLEVRDRMTTELQSALDADERGFLLSLVQNNPDWLRLGVSHAEELPGIRWKLHNLGLLQTTNPKKFAAQVESLERLL